jgi:hypothetical protein
MMGDEEKKPRYEPGLTQRVLVLVWNGTLSSELTQSEVCCEKINDVVVCTGKGEI